jgi:hypothetical protein
MGIGYRRRTTMKTLEQTLLDMGANEWQKNGHHRLYVSREVIAEVIGLTWESYKSGSISSAELNGRPLSNSKATRILSNLTSANLYYDVKKSNFTWNQTDSNEYVQEFIKFLQNEDEE